MWVEVLCYIGQIGSIHDQRQVNQDFLESRQSCAIVFQKKNLYVEIKKYITTV